jgi:hypothetical protein
MISALESLGRRGGGDLIRARYIGLLNTFIHHSRLDSFQRDR